MAGHAEITQKTGVAIYFCDPASSWKDGSNEIINGLNRQFLRARVCRYIARAELDAITLQLNIRPCKRFDFMYPMEVMGEVMQKSIAMRDDATISSQ